MSVVLVVVPVKLAFHSVHVESPLFLYCTS